VRCLFGCAGIIVNMIELNTVESGELRLNVQQFSIRAAVHDVLQVYVAIWPLPLNSTRPRSSRRSPGVPATAAPRWHPTPARGPASPSTPLRGARRARPRAVRPAHARCSPRARAHVLRLAVLTVSPNI
jgi:hypothetical protein